jgi:hypothetical protein
VRLDLPGRALPDGDATEEGPDTDTDAQHAEPRA